jgi:hypothetical protein
MVPFELANVIHEDRLCEAKKRQLYQQVAHDVPPFRERLLRRLRGFLIAIGNQVEANSDVYEGAHPMIHGF